MYLYIFKGALNVKLTPKIAKFQSVFPNREGNRVRVNNLLNDILIYIASSM